MKKTPRIRQRRMTRREFVAGAVASATAIAGAPALLRGRNLNDKLDIAFIACGGRALASLSELTLIPERANTADDGGAGRGASEPAALHPDENVAVLCDVSQVAIDAALQRFPKAKTYNDLRRVFDRPNDFDAVVVSTAEHTHAFATYL